MTPRDQRVLASEQKQQEGTYDSNNTGKHIGNDSLLHFQPSEKLCVQCLLTDRRLDEAR
jgi:hypothetical protein